MTCSVFQIPLAGEHELVDSNEIVSQGGSMLMLATHTEDGQLVHVPYNGPDLTDEYYIVRDSDNCVLASDGQDTKEYYITKDGTLYDPRELDDASVAIEQPVFVDQHEYAVPYIEQEIECGGIEGVTEENVYTSVTVDDDAVPLDDNVVQKKCRKRKSSQKGITPLKKGVAAMSDDQLSPNSSSTIQVHHPTISTLLSPPINGSSSDIRDAGSDVTVDKSNSDVKLQTVCDSSLNVTQRKDTKSLISLQHDGNKYTVCMSSLPGEVDNDDVAATTMPFIILNQENKTLEEIGSLQSPQLMKITNTKDEVPTPQPSDNNETYVLTNYGKKTVLVKSASQPVPIRPSTTSGHKIKETLADKYIKDWKPTGRHQCKLCVYSCVTHNFLFRHWLMAHCTLRPYSCCYCKFSSPNKDAITRHQTAIHKGSAKDIKVDHELERHVRLQYNAIFDDNHDVAAGTCLDNCETAADANPIYITSPTLMRVQLDPTRNAARSIMPAPQMLPNSSIQPTSQSSITNVGPMTMQKLKQVLEGKIEYPKQHQVQHQVGVPKQCAYSYTIANPSVRPKPTTAGSVPNQMIAPADAVLYGIPTITNNSHATPNPTITSILKSSIIVPSMSNVNAVVLNDGTDAPQTTSMIPLATTSTTPPTPVPQSSHAVLRSQLAAPIRNSHAILRHELTAASLQPQTLETVDKL